ncbi:SDR family NAD(P)-dependent oxidoreductase [Curtobacterium pusillum]|uniref:SDR family NAD(P)-dependent oxidoreductase n=1 Tax=Curtobacterium pusillum TaxID=69373 RepID=UPI0038173E0E
MSQYWSSTSLSDKSVIVTGAGRGIGRALAESLAERGASVLAVDLDEASITTAAEELTAKGYTVVGLAQDITQPGAADTIVARAVEAFGHLDALVNNAMAGHMPTPLQDLTEEQWNISYATGPHATFELMKAAYPHLKASGSGSIVNFASGAGTMGLAGFTGYGSAKEAIRGLSKVAAKDWGPEGIRVNVVAPAAFTEGMAQWKANAPEQFEASLQNIPLRRVGDPHDDIAPVVSFLVSDESRYLTSQTILVDGGTDGVR